jgi:purine-cytosine permease-like protein
MNNEIQLTDHEKKLYWLGAVVFAVLIFISFILGFFVSPLRLLQYRLFVVGIALVYNLTIFLFYQYYLKKKLEIITDKPSEVVIWFNGRELERM